MTTAESLLRAINESPDDDAPRFVYADFLDERGQEGDRERAEFIRVQIELANMEGDPWPKRRQMESRESNLFSNLHSGFDGEMWHYCNKKPENVISGIYAEWRRGFPDSVTLTLAQLVGGECLTCDGAGEYEAAHGDNSEMGPCLDCGGEWDGSEEGYSRGTGRIDGLARVIGQWPVTEIRISDAVIHPSGGNDTYYVGGLGVFPKEYWARLEGHRTRSAALAALSDAAVSLVRETEGLRPVYLNQSHRQTSTAATSARPAARAFATETAVG